MYTAEIPKEGKRSSYTQQVPEQWQKMSSSAFSEIKQRLEVSLLSRKLRLVIIINTLKGKAIPMLVENFTFLLSHSQNEVFTAEQDARRAGFVTIAQAERPFKKIQVFSKNGLSVQTPEPAKTLKPKEPEMEFKTKKQITKHNVVTQRKRKNSSDQEYSFKTQKKDRNVVSNLIHHLIKFVTTYQSQEEVVRRIIKFKNMSISYDEFAKSLKEISKNLKTYVTVNHIKSLWFSDAPEKSQFVMLMRILSKKFFSKHGFVSVFHSNKFNSTSKLVHYKGVRSLIEVLVKKDLELLRSNLA